jgi:RNA 2',3'-cyclic 3'-phosphodiesterase
MRLFFAVPIPETLKRILEQFQERSRSMDRSASWPKPDGLHITLAFLGEQEALLVPTLLDIARSTGSKREAFPLSTSRLGGFPKNGAARVLWLGFAEEPRLFALAEDLRKRLKVAGIAFDEKPFKAHLTLARFKSPREIAVFGETPPPSIFEVKELVLFQSQSTSSGSRYIPLGNAPFTGA